MQEMFDIDHAEAEKLTSQEGRTRYGVEHELSQSAREPKLIIGRFGCIAGDHTVPHAEHISLLRAAQHAARFWKDDGFDLCFVSDCHLLVDNWKRGRQYCCGAQHWFADIWRQVFAILDRKFGSRWRVQKVAAHQSRAEVDSGRPSHHECLGNSKADEMARSGATRYAVAPGDVYAHGAAWDKATDLALFLSEAALHICSSGEWSSDVKKAEDVEIRDVAPAPGLRFTKLRGLLIAGDVLDANGMLATIQRQRHSEGRLAYHCLEELVGRLHRFRECTCLTRFSVLGRSHGAPCAGHTAQTAALRCDNVAQAHVPIRQGASVCVSWSLAAIRLLELGCWMMQLRLCKFFFVRAQFFVWALTSHVQGKEQTKQTTDFYLHSSLESFS